MPRMNKIPVVNARGVQRRMRLFRDGMIQGPSWKKWALSKIKFKWEGPGERGYCGQRFGNRNEIGGVSFFFTVIQTDWTEMSTLGENWRKVRLDRPYIQKSGLKYQTGLYNLIPFRRLL